jgi:membrane protein DedA with SNARE-associated domain
MTAILCHERPQGIGQLDNDRPGWAIHQASSPNRRVCDHRARGASIVRHLRRHLERAALAVSAPALLHIHLHHRFHGPPFDYAGLAAAAAASWIGLPGPGEPVLIAAGILAAHHKLDIGSVVSVAFVAAAAGGVAGWLLGRVAGRTVLTAPGPLLSARLSAVRRGDAVFERYTVLAILVAPSWAAGINRVPATTYNVVNLVTAAIWAAGLGFGAYFVGPPIVDVVDDLSSVAEAILLVVVIVAAAVGLRRWLRARRRRSDGDGDGDGDGGPRARSATS